MSTPTLVSGSRMLRTADWLWDRDLEARDNAALIAYDRRESIERAVTFDELLEECATQFTGPQMEAFMGALARGGNADLHLMYCLLDQAKENIVKRRLAGGV
jgi:uncharacterized protein CbrC (UPF0167 family)